MDAEQKAFIEGAAYHQGESLKEMTAMEGENAALKIRLRELDGLCFDVYESIPVRMMHLQPRPIRMLWDLGRDIKESRK